MSPTDKYDVISCLLSPARLALVVATEFRGFALQPANARGPTNKLSIGHWSNSDVPERPVATVSWGSESAENAGEFYVDIQDGDVGANESKLTDRMVGFGSY